MNLEKPNYISNLEEVYGSSSQEAYGTAVFFKILKEFDIDAASLEVYQYFTGDLWEEWGEEAWMGSWKQVYDREKGREGDILNELRDIDDPDAKISIPMFLEGISEPQKANQALQGAFDDPEVSQLVVYNIGDGGAMSGILIGSYREKTSQATFLVWLFD